MSNKFISSQVNEGARTAIQRCLVDLGYSLARSDMDERLKVLLSERDRLVVIVNGRRSDLEDLQLAKRRDRAELEVARKSLADAQLELDMFDSGVQGAEIRGFLESDSREPLSR